MRVLTLCLVSSNSELELEQQHLEQHQVVFESQQNASLITKIDALKNQSKEKEDKYIDEAIDLEKQKKKLENIIYKVGQSTQTMHMLTKPQVFYDDIHKQALGYQNPFYLKKAQQIKPTLYDGHVITKKHDVICVANSEKTLILAEDSRTKMMEKQNDPISKDKKVNISPINYAELNKLSEDFGKRFVPQKELSAEQAFWVVKVRATHDAITEGAWGFEHTKEVFMKEVIPFLKSLKELFNDFDKGLNLEINEVKTVFEQMEATLDQCSVDKKYIEIEKNELILDTERLLEHIICQDVMNVLLISQDIVHIAVNSLAAINDYKNMQKSFVDEYNETLELKAELAKKNDMIEKNNREAHVDYLKHTQENADILHEIVEQARELRPLDSDLESACKQGKLGGSCSTESSGSQTKSNTKKNRITRTSRSNKKNNKVEDQPRIVKSSLNNVNHVSNTPCNANVKHFMLNVNSKLICATFNECMFDVIHDSCVHVYLNGVNARVESKSVKSVKSNKKKVWKSIDKFLGTVRFGNDQIAKIMGYGAYHLGNVTIFRVYYVEGLGYNFFLLDNSLWHRRLSHLNIGTLNHLAKQGLGRGLPKQKFKKDRLCLACSLGKSKKSSHKPKAEDTNQEKLYLLHMDLCGPMRIESINRKKYILVFVDDYSRFTWVKFLRSKDETHEVIIKCLKQIQVRLNATVRNVKTDNGNEFVNQTVKDYYENVRITHQTSIARTPQQNAVVERRNRTLVEVARTMLIYSKALLYLWAEAISTACYT
ncbi:retrovirus-related pol polyprotein from transposon TNT 1-94 [Tanacetum coccineum]